MWAHVAFVIVTAAHLARHVVILTTADYRLITAHLVITAVRYEGCAILLEKTPHTFVISRAALDQILVLVAFQSTLFTVIFSATTYITLQSCHWSRRRETRKQVQNTLTPMFITIFISFNIVFSWLSRGSFLDFKLLVITGPLKLFCFPFQMRVSKVLKIIQWSYQVINETKRTSLEVRTSWDFDFKIRFRRARFM